MYGKLKNKYRKTVGLLLESHLAVMSDLLGLTAPVRGSLGMASGLGLPSLKQQACRSCVHTPGLQVYE